MAHEELRVTHCWLSHGSPAITALSDEKEDTTVEEVEDNEQEGREQEDSQIQPLHKTKISNYTTGNYSHFHRL